MRSEFGRIEKAPPASALGDLSNAILPIFRAENFPDVRDYDAIAPSTRLASKLLKHHSIQPMLRTILTHGPLISTGEVDNDDPKSPKELFEYPPDTTRVNRRDTRLIDASLDELADFVEFRADPAFPLGTAATVAVSGCNKNTRWLRGVRSVTTYSAAIQDILLNEANRIQQNRRRQPDMPLLLAYRFSFAVELAHEVCHALAFARDGRSRDIETDPFLPDHPVAELGFAMEQTLFGGHFNMLWDEPETPTEQSQQQAAAEADEFKFHRKNARAASDLVGLPVLWSWPCTWIYKDYVHNKCGIWIREADRVLLPPKDIAWRVPVADLARFFSMEFWEHGVPEVRLERKVGFAFSCNEQGEKKPAYFTARQVEVHVPEGYEVSGDRAIVRQE
ncbi:hypothetical protein Q7P37_008579 [Cladosporium fusiforme]